MIIEQKKDMIFTMRECEHLKVEAYYVQATHTDRGCSVLPQIHLPV
jgi:hypothetical protein